MAILNEILIKELRNYDLDCTTEQMEEAIAAADAAFSDWDDMNSIVQHAMVVASHLELLSADVISAVSAEDWEAAATAIDDATGDAEQKAYIAERVALHASGDTQSSRDGTDDAE